MSGLFRVEAIRRYLDRGGRGEVARLTPGWTGATFWLIVAAAVTGFLFLHFATVDEVASGPAVQREGTVVEAFLPGAYASRLRPGLPVVVRFEGEREAVRGSIETVESRVLSPDETRRRLGDAVEGAHVVVAARVAAGVEGRRGRAEVAVATRRLGEALLH